MITSFPVRGYSIRTRIKTAYHQAVPDRSKESEGIPLEQGLRQISHKLIHKNLSYRIFHQNKDLERKLGDSNLNYGKSIAIPQKQEPQTKI